jgi:cob(I)alamin adenosyltransferase
MMIYVYTGDGEGKTHIALGMALRAVGHKQRVVIVQFMKGKQSGELLAAERLEPYLIVKQFGRPEFIDKGKAMPEDYSYAEQALSFASEALKTRPNLLILDEINIAMDFGLVKVSDVVGMLRSKPRSTVIVLTGRNAPKEIIAIADMVSEIKKVKHPYDSGIKGKKGIEF